mmetsp:Transcript_31442/g.97125  ORF Transcript_31442/g.97125 Transcript_31442/m.97125 type:complete len:1032 (-) Transcript_31442:322-3417(-)|eukprot:CAMPEP_0174854790 /NCGR_PEP_ID=MMETSP1114-20130205/31950_1 /TAXON_ID=312471 /ORGANISM="Neobodo designis, Strain CCAP 1951/1" /LENGTH=1031 /DNA_ID=CAMNT_0016089501 /DNA_START=213 /DNA_END=3308 /DNA_ORIENTATION=-
MAGRNTNRWFMSVRNPDADEEGEELVPPVNRGLVTQAPAYTGHEAVPVLELDEAAARPNEPIDIAASASKEGDDDADGKKKDKKKKKKEASGDSDEEDADNAPRPDDRAYDGILGLTAEDYAEEGDAAAKAQTAKQREKARRREKKKRARLELRMSIKFVIETLETKLEETVLTKELFVYIPFLIMFIFLFMIGASTEQAYWARAQLGGQLSGGQFPSLEAYEWTLDPRQPEAYHVSTTLMEVRNPQDWHMWFQSIVLDFWWDLPGDNDAAIANSWVQGSNMKFGAMRLRTLRMRNDSCSLVPAVNAWNYSKGSGEAGGILRESEACWGKFDADKLNRTTFGPPSDPTLLHYIDCSAASRQKLFGFVDVYPCAGNAVEFPTMMSRAQVKSIAESLRGKQAYNLGTVSDDDLAEGYGFDDPLFHPFATRAVILEFFSYLPFIDQFQAYKVLTELTAGGRFVHFLQINTFAIWSLTRVSDWVNTIYFFLFYVFVLYYVAKLIAATIASFATGRAIEFFTDFWNFWDFVNLICFLAVAVFRLAWIRSSQQFHGTELLASTSYDDNLDFIALLFNLQLWLNAVNTVISFLKILKFIELNPTLNIVTRSLASAQQSLIGVLVIFVIVIVSYGITGVAIFSNGLEDFRDLNTSMSTLMRMLIGDFDYIALRDENRFAAPLFFWSFMILGLFLILNFLIGIILEAFEDESDTTRAEPIPLLISRFWKRISAGIKNFISDPKRYLELRRDRRAHHFAREGTRLEVVIEQLKQFRLLAILERHSLAELEQLTDAEIERLLDDDQINRHDFPRIFEKVDPDEADERLQWITADYLDQLWELCVRNYHVHRLGDEDADAEELRVALEAAAEDALAFVVGIGRGRGNDAARKDARTDNIIGKTDEDDDVLETVETSAEKKSRADKEKHEHLAAVQQLFRPSEEIRNKVRTMEQSLAEAQEEAVAILRAVLRQTPAVDAKGSSPPSNSRPAEVLAKLRANIIAAEQAKQSAQAAKEAEAQGTTLTSQQSAAFTMQHDDGAASPY